MKNLIKISPKRLLFATAYMNLIAFQLPVAEAANCVYDSVAATTINGNQVCTGSAGADGTEGNNGSDGGIALSASNSTLTFNNTFTATGGTGGAGGNSKAGMLPVGDGGDGGIALSASNSTLTFNDAFTATGGTGGAGGNSKAGMLPVGDGGGAFLATNSTLNFNSTFTAIAGSGDFSGIAFSTTNSILTFKDNFTATSSFSSKDNIVFSATNSILTFSGDITLFKQGVAADIGNFDNSTIAFDLGENTRTYKGTINFKNDSSLSIKTKYSEANDGFGSITHSKGTLDLSSGLKTIKITPDLSTYSLPKVGKIRETLIFAGANQGAVTLPANDNVTLEITYNNGEESYANLVDWVYKDAKLTNRIKEEFNHGIEINTALEANGAGQGILKFLGGATINKDIGTPMAALNEVRFLANDTTKTVNLNSNIYAGGIYLGKATYAPSNNVTITSANVATTHLDNPTFDLGQNTLKFSGAVIHDDPNGTITINTTYDGAKAGHIEQTGGNFNLNQNVSNLVINLTEDPTLTFPKVGQIRQATIFDTSGLGSYTLPNADSVILITLYNNNNEPHENLLEWKYNNGVLENRIRSEFNHGIEINTALEADGAGQGTIKFLGGAIINKDIGTSRTPLNEVRFSADDITKTINLNSNIYAGEIYLAKAKYAPSNDATLTSTNLDTIHLNNPTFDLGQNTLKFSGAVVHDDPNGTITINTTHNGENAGHIEMTKIGDSINLTNSKALIINITDAPMTAQPVAGEVRSYDLFVENGGTLTLNSDGNTINGFTAANEVNKFVEWSFDHNTGILSEKLVENKEAVLQDIINTPDQNQNLSNLSGSVIQDLINLTASEGADAAREAVERLVNTDSIALATAVAPIINESTLVVSERASGLSRPLQKLDSLNLFSPTISGVSSGDEYKRYGAWVSPFFGKTVQKIRNKQPGYKSEYYGGTLGLDGLVDEGFALGVATTFAKSIIKHTDQNLGDKTKADTFAFSGYGTYELTDKWFTQTIFSFSHSRIKNRELRKEFSRVNIASANYSSDMLSGNVTFGYNHNLKQNLLLTPTFGLEYNRQNRISYKEHGTNFQNLQVTRKGLNQFEGILGCTLAGSYKLSNGYLITPEIHGQYSFKFIKKNLDIMVRSLNFSNSQSSLTPRTTTIARSVFNVGAGIKLNRGDNIDYTIDYNARIADQYRSHQGSLNIRVNF